MNNLTICIFDDVKFVNSNELTVVEPIDDITIHMESPEIKDTLLVGQCIAIYNVAIDQTNDDESVALVCYSPKKRESLQQALASQSPVKIVGTKKNSKKCLIE